MLGRRHRSDDERVPRKDRMGASPVVVGAVVLVVACIGVFFGFAKHVPFTHGFRVKAVFESSNSIRKNSPVRIAGVNVGKVVKVEGKPGSDAAVVTMDVTSKGLPIHKDATFKIRPRIFLEGNFFVDVTPGTPSAPTIDDGDTIPITQTATPVQLDQVLSALQSDTRTSLQKTLDGLGTGLNYKPSKAQDTDADPSARGESGGESLNDADPLRRALAEGHGDRGRRLPRDRGPRPLTTHRRVEPHHRGPGAQRRAAQATSSTNFNTTVAATASQAANLSASIRLLGPTLQNADRALDSLNASFPNTRAFAREILPGVNETAATIDAAFPWIAQARGLLGPSELQGVAAELSPATSDLAKVVDATLALLPQADLTAKCTTQGRAADRRREDRRRPAARPAPRTTRSSGTRWSASPARARTSTATACTCASSPAAATRPISLGASGGIDRQAVRQRDPQAAGHAAGVPGQAPALQARRALLQEHAARTSTGRRPGPPDGGGATARASQPRVERGR